MNTNSSERRRWDFITWDSWNNLQRTSLFGRREHAGRVPHAQEVNLIELAEFIASGTFYGRRFIPQANVAATYSSTSLCVLRRNKN